MSFIDTILRSMVANRRGVYGSFADTYDMVYFGSIGSQDDEHRVVRGVTVSTQHVDNHYCVGTVHGYDVVLVERTDKLIEPTSTKSESYKWIIMQVDLKSPHPLPHAFLDGGHHDKVFYKHIFMKFSKLKKVDESFLGSASSGFAERFGVYCPVAAIDTIAFILNKNVTETLSAHFSHLDFEWYDDMLFVYSNNSTPSTALLEHMLRASLWLARELDETGSRLAAQPIYTLTPDETVSSGDI